MVQLAIIERFTVWLGKKISAFKDTGDLGLKDLKEFNLAMVSK